MYLHKVTTKTVLNPKSTPRIPFNNRTILYVMSTPCFILVIIFGYLPLLGWGITFFNYKPGLNLFQCDFTGLKYFKLALFEPELIPVIRNTLAISFLGLLATPVPALFAIFLSEVNSSRIKKLVQVTTTLPNFISWVLVYSIVVGLFSANEGLVNSLLKNMGLIKNFLNPIANSDITWYFQTILALWKNVGYSAIIYFASLAGIDQEIYDAANVDGAGRVAKIRHITIPGLFSTYIVLLVLGIGNMLSNGFEQFYIFYNPVVHDKIQVLDYYLYRIGISSQQFSLASALGISKTLISVILLTFANLVSKKLRGQYIF